MLWKFHGKSDTSLLQVFVLDAIHAELIVYSIWLDLQEQVWRKKKGV